ncbi:MAG: hypothetical protein GX444_20900 [Myxococcales bacterium]|nr:hypothetical protein [Myxococcales bacterium]
MTKDEILLALRERRSLAGLEPANLDLTGVDFTGVDLSGTTFRACRLSGAIFRRAVLSGARFDRCRLAGADFTEADLRGLGFSQCRGLPPRTIARLESQGAVVNKPTGNYAAILGAAVILLTALLVYWLVPNSSPSVNPTNPSAAAPATDAAAAKPENEEAAARQAEEIGDWPGAVDRLQKLTTREPNNAQLLLRYARAAENAERYDVAAAVLERLKPLSLGEAERLQMQTLTAALQIRTGKREEGNALFAQMLTQHISEAGLLNRRMILLEWGTVAWKTGDLKGARQHFEALLAISAPEEAAGINLNLALVERAAGNRAAERAAYLAVINDAKASETMKANAEIAVSLLDLEGQEPGKRFAALGVAIAKGADPGQALQAIRRIIEQNGKKLSPEAMIALYRQAMPLLEKAAPQLNDLRVDLANLLLRQAMADEALKIYRQVAEQSPVAAQRAWAADMAMELQNRQKASEPAPGAK